MQYLSEAHATEQALVTVLQSQIAMTPGGSYRNGLESHLRETRDHATRVQRRLDELGQGSSPIQAGVGLVQSVVGQALALGKTPLDLVRGTGGEEKVLKNAKDACATEALEIATYTAIERLASSVGDKATQALADSIRADEQKMLDRILREIPKLTEAMVRSEIRGNPSYDISKTGAADAARSASESVKETARDATSSAKRTARKARKVPGVAQAEGQVKGALASEGRPGNHRLREAHRCGDCRKARTSLAGRPREDRLLRAQERKPHDHPQPDHQSARRRAVAGI